MSYNFGIALKKKDFTDGLKRWEILDLYDKIEFEKEVYPVEFEAREQECSAMGFITAEAANRFDYDYEESGLHNFIALILDNEGLESEDCCYEFGGIKIWIGNKVSEDLISRKVYKRECEEIRTQEIKAAAAGEKIWKVPVFWQASGHYLVRAKSFEEAAKYIEEAKDLPLPADADFIDSTFEVDYEGKGIHNDEDGTVDPIDTTTIYTATSGL